MTKDRRVFSPEVKLSTVKSVLAGEDIRDLARELKVPAFVPLPTESHLLESGVAAFKTKRGRPWSTGAGPVSEVGYSPVKCPRNKIGEFW